jgi:arginyl-tRNA synthetase
MSIEEDLTAWLRAGLAAAADGLGLDAASLPEPELLAPRQKEHGDFATNVALTLAKPARRSPRDVAQVLVDSLAPAAFVERVEIAGPGFLNVFTTRGWLHDALRAIAETGSDYGRVAPHGRRIQVEFVSANPTGPLHVGHARNAALGDTLARLLEAAGWTAEREYYFNDAGRQMDLFGASVAGRYLQILGRDATVPEDGYHGDYVTALAREIVAEHGDTFADLQDEERDVALLAEGSRRILDQIADTLARFGVRFDSYFSEAELQRRGEIDGAVRRLRDAGVAYDAEGATWFRSTDFGDDKDRVIVRSNGQHTYFGADCAYLVDKFSRGFDRILYVWGADHHGDVVRVRGAASAMGYDPDAVEILLYQFVAFLRGGETMKMSKRAGTIVTLDQLIDEVGADAARFTLLNFSSDSAVNFDIEAVKQQTMDNPVYYVQYGHARIASILRRARERGIELRPVGEVDLGLLTHPTEVDLLKALAELPGVIATAAELRAPHRITHASQDLAGRFHRFYAECQVVDPGAPELTQARLWLCAGTKQGIANLLALVGVSAPESMERTGEAWGEADHDRDG